LRNFTLERWVLTKKLNETTVIKWLIQICKQAIILSKIQLVHGAINSQNLCVLDNKKLKLFAIPLALPERHISEYFTAPEGPHTQASDIWSIGRILYILGVGEPEPKKNLFTLKLQQLMLSMLADVPEKRPTLYQIFSHELVIPHLSDEDLMFTLPEKATFGKPIEQFEYDY